MKQQEPATRESAGHSSNPTDIKTAIPVSLTAAQREGTLHEKNRVARLNRIRQFVFGSLDGLLVPLGVVSGVAGGTGNIKAVIVAGLAEVFAGGISMGAGEYLSGRAQAQVQQAAVNEELEQIRRHPAYELQELIFILESEGVQSEDAIVIAKRLYANPEAFAQTMVEKELGLAVKQETVRIGDGVTMGLSYVMASIVPLISYFFLPIGEAFIASIALTIVVLAGIGIIRGKLAKINLVISALEVVAVGTVRTWWLLSGCLVAQITWLLISLVAMQSREPVERDDAA